MLIVCSHHLSVIASMQMQMYWTVHGRLENLMMKMAGSPPSLFRRPFHLATQFGIFMLGQVRTQTHYFYANLSCVFEGLMCVTCIKVVGHRAYSRPIFKRAAMSSVSDNEAELA